MYYIVVIEIDSFITLSHPHLFGVDAGRKEVSRMQECRMQEKYTVLHHRRQHSIGYAECAH